MSNLVTYESKVITPFLTTNSVGENFHSKLESQFSELLVSNNIEFARQITISFSPNKYNFNRKVVDFKVGELLVEVTGLYKDYTGDLFKRKIRILQETIESPILVITNKKNINRLKCLRTPRVKVFTVEQEKFVLNTIAKYKN